MRGMRSTLVLLVVALALGAYIYFVESDRPPSGTPDALEAVFDVDSDDIDSLSVTAGNGDRTVIEKDGDRWRIVEPFPVNVDVTEVVSLSSSLANLEMQRVVAGARGRPRAGGVRARRAPHRGRLHDRRRHRRPAAHRRAQPRRQRPLRDRRGLGPRLPHLRVPGHDLRPDHVRPARQVHPGHHPQRGGLPRDRGARPSRSGCGRRTASGRSSAPSRPGPTSG